MSKADIHRIKINLMSRAYISQKLMIKESEMGLIDRRLEDLLEAKKICIHVENIVEILDDRFRIIIENELLFGKTGKWYIGKMSEPSYYRLRKKAYKTFFALLEK